MLLQFHVYVFVNEFHFISVSELGTVSENDWESVLLAQVPWSLHSTIANGGGGGGGGPISEIIIGEMLGSNPVS